MKRRDRKPAAPRPSNRKLFGLLLLLWGLAVLLWAREPLYRRWLASLDGAGLAAYVEQHPDDTEAQFRRAEQLLDQGEAAQAEVLLQRLLERRPTLHRAWVLRSGAELAQNKLAQAHASIQVALPLAEKSGEARWRLGQVLLRRGEEAAAEAEFRRAAELAPDLVGARLELGRIELARRHYGAARLHLERVLRRNARHGEALALLSTACRYLGDLRQAEALARQATQSDPAAARAWDALAQAQHSWATPEKLAEAEKAYRRVIELDPAPAEAYFHLGRIQFSRGEWATALQSLRRSLEIQPLSRFPYPLLLQCYRRLGRTVEAAAAQKEFDRINEMDLATAPLEYTVYAIPENAAARLRLARLYLRYRRPDLAGAQVAQVLVLNPAHPEALKLRRQLEARGRR